MVGPLTWPLGLEGSVSGPVTHSVSIYKYDLKWVLKLHHCELGNLELYMIFFFLCSVQIRCNNPQCGGGEPGRLQKLQNAGGS